MEIGCQCKTQDKECIPSDQQRKSRKTQDKERIPPDQQHVAVTVSVLIPFLQSRVQEAQQAVKKHRGS